MEITYELLCQTLISCRSICIDLTASFVAVMQYPLDVVPSKSVVTLNYGHREDIQEINLKRSH
jgi:hypothetical protein